MFDPILKTAGRRAKLTTGAFGVNVPGHTRF